MKTLTLKIFTNTFLVGVLVYFASALLFVFSMYGYFEKQMFTELESECNFLEPYVLNDEISRIKSLITKNRITLIYPNGTVYFDNEVDATTLENHALRKEFVEAVKNGTFSLARYSSTMMQKTLYFAKLLPNNHVVRVSCKQNSVVAIALDMRFTLLLMLAIAVVVSLIAADVISKKIVEPFNKIDLENPEKSDIYEELKPFAHRIAQENQEKNKREEFRKQFTANVSHELKTPLTSISGFAEILKNGGVGKKKTIDFATTIYNETQRLIVLVNDIINLSKLDEADINSKKQDVNLVEIVQNATSDLQESAHKKGVTINVNVEEKAQDYVIQGVPSVLYEMIYNLIDNAIKYNKKGGEVFVCITNKNPNNNEKQNLLNEQNTRNVTISVKDTGIGIPLNEREHIFERFYRVDKSRSKALGGTGLGLSIVKHAAKCHGATVTVKSDEGKGSEFIITF